MKREATVKAVFLSPVFWQYPTLKWEGKKLVVVPPENLDSNKTYVLTIGADALGYHDNKLGKSQSFAFSTGSQIDSCSISGRVYSPDGTARSLDIWAYSYPDTAFDFLREIPDYATQIDSLGGFSIENMKKGRYLVIAVGDGNDDLFWDPSSEPIGLPPGIITIAGNEQFRGLTLRADRRDTLTAYVSRVRVIDNRRLEIEFSQPLSSKNRIDPATYRVIARKDSSSLEVEGAYPGEANLVVLETALQQEKTDYKLYTKGLVSDWGNPFDTAGASFEGSAKVDTSGPQLLLTFPSDGSRTVYQDSVIEMTFSERIRPLGFREAVLCVADSTDTLSFAPRWIQPNFVRMVVTGGIPREQKIVVKLLPESIFDIAGNRMPDSVREFSFRLPPADTVGIVTANTEPNDKIIATLRPYGRGGDTYETTSDVNGNIIFGSVLPGAFRFDLFEDSDGNGKWSSGVVSPFTPSERFSFLPDSISVRSRWTTGIGRVELPAVR